jgi:hypothetical protein
MFLNIITPCSRSKKFKSNKDGSPILTGTLFAINHINFHNFVIKSSLMKKT